MSRFAINPRRTYLIARRDFLGYVKTWGFWLTALGPFIGIIFGILAPLLLANSEPTRYATILDETGQHAAAIEQKLTQDNERNTKKALKNLHAHAIPRDQREEFNTILEKDGSEAAKEYIEKSNLFIAKKIKSPEYKLKFVPPPATTMQDLEPYILGKKLISVDGANQKLAGVLHIKRVDQQIKAEYWTTSPSNNASVSLARRHFQVQNLDSYLESAGLSREGYNKAFEDAIPVSTFNPEKSADEDGGQKVTGKDMIPYFVAAALSMMLWFTVFTGAYMLLVSMVEEKINKVLEMLLASTRFSEIFFGKLLGVAALTIASLLPWILLGALGFFAAMTLADGAVAEGLAKAMGPKMLTFLPIFFVLGYVFYGSMFIALGAMAESMQDASTLMTPMVLMLTACILIVPIGITYPDSPLLTAAQYFPFSAPFAAIIRLPSDPPLWETLASVGILILSSCFVVWLAGRMFRHGVLSGGGMAAVKDWFSRAVLRRKVR